MQLLKTRALPAAVSQFNDESCRPPAGGPSPLARLGRHDKAVTSLSRAGRAGQPGRRLGVRQ